MAVLDSCTARTPHPPTEVFARWADPSTWPDWDPEVRAVVVEGPVRQGARGRLRPTSGPTATFSITELLPERSLTSTTTLPGARLVVEHRVSPDGEGSELDVVVRVEGPFAALWSRILGRSMRRAARSSVSGLLAHLEAA